MAEFLVQNGADPMQADAEGVTPLLLAVRAANLPLAALLFSRLSGSASRDRARLVDAAAACGDAQMVALVAERVGNEPPAAAAQTATAGAGAAAKSDGSGSPTEGGRTRGDSLRDAKAKPAAAESKAPEATKEPAKEAAKEAAKEGAKDAGKEGAKEKEGGGGTKSGLLKRITSLRGSFMPSSGDRNSGGEGK